MKDIMNGNISYEKLIKIINETPKIWEITEGKNINNITEFFKKAAGLDIDPLDAKLLFSKKGKFRLIHNPSVRKLLFSQTTKTSLRQEIVQTRLYSYEKEVDFDKMMKAIRKFDSKFNTLSKEQKKLFQSLIDSTDISSLKQFKNLTEHMDKVLLTGLSDEQLKLLTKELSKNLDAIADQNKINTMIDDIKKANINVAPT